ncbi:MAG: delta-60 repeat domain-containing protein, partial [Chitinophagales bacterium]|nr:delta-60 repeat domain-containing protein [Chitinophagales bacterium]
MKNFITLGKVLSIGFCWFFNFIQSQSSGILDPDFNGNGKLSFSFSQQSDYCSDVTIDNNQKIIAAGSSNLSGKKCFAIARLNPDGSFDNSFSSDGKVQTVIANSDATLSKILIQPDNKILAAGSNSNGFVIARYLTNGDLDNSFSFDGIVTTAVSANFGAAALDKNGNIYLVGGKGANDSNIVIAKYKPDGSLDQNFGSAGVKTVVINTDPQPRFIQVDANGNMVIIGDYIKSSVKYIFYTRLTPTGNYDISVLGTNRHK